MGIPILNILITSNHRRILLLRLLLLLLLIRVILVFRRRDIIQMFPGHRTWVATPRTVHHLYNISDMILYHRAARLTHHLTVARLCTFLPTVHLLPIVTVTAGLLLTIILHRLQEVPHKIPLCRNRRNNTRRNTLNSRVFAVCLLQAHRIAQIPLHRLYGRRLQILIRVRMALRATCHHYQAYPQFQLIGPACLSHLCSVAHL